MKKRLRLTKDDKWKIYEEEKKEIQKRNLPPKEYQQAIRELCKRLGI